jgi:putative membrane protein
MKTVLFLFLSIAVLFGCKSGGNNDNNTDSTAMDNGVQTMDNTNTWDQDKIKEFVDDATSGGLLEVKLGQIAQKKALSKEVKDYGKMMEKDHGDANDKLKTAIQSLNLTVPSDLDKDHQDKIDNLNKKSGKEFDKDYIDKMVDDHKSDIDDFEDAQKNLPSGELRTWVENTLPVLRQHLTQAQTIQDQLKNQK